MSELLKGKEFTLVRDCTATLIPAGDSLTLEAGTEVTVSQALGGSVTVQARGVLCRIGSEDVDALGNGIASTPEGEKPGTSRVGQGKMRGDPLNEAEVWEVLKECYDPEIPINIVDLGLIYDLKITDLGAHEYAVQVKMTLTARGCGMGPVIAEDARKKIEAIPGVDAATVDVVWDPPWSPHMISPEGRSRLGLE